MAAPMNPMNQALNQAITERDQARQELQDMREDRTGWRLVRWARAGNHHILGVIMVVIAVLGVLAWVFHNEGPKVGLVAIGCGIVGVIIYAVVSMLANRQNHEGQP